MGSFVGIAKKITLTITFVLQRLLAATGQHIDQFVYELYGLTEEEIKIVEGADK